MKVTGTYERQGYVELVVEGTFAIAKLPELLKAAAEATTRVDGHRLLVNLYALDGFASTMHRYELGKGASQLPKGTRIATLANAEKIDPEKFGVSVARNRGADIEVFDNEPAAVRWLLEKAAD